MNFAGTSGHGLGWRNSGQNFYFCPSKNKQLVRYARKHLGFKFYTAPRVFKGRWPGRHFARNVFAVNANRNPNGWNVNLNEFANANRWNAENRVSLRNYLFSPVKF